MFEWIGSLLYSENRTVFIIVFFVAAAVCFVLSMLTCGGEDPFFNTIALICVAIAIFLLVGSALVGPTTTQTTYLEQCF